MPAALRADASPVSPPRSQDRFFFDAVDDSLVVVDLQDWEFVVLNGPAGAIWLSLLDTPQPEAALAETVARQFAASPEQVGADAASLLSDWSRRGWVERTGDAISIPGRRSAQDTLKYETVPEAEFRARTGEARGVWRGALGFFGRCVAVSLYAAPEPLHADLALRAQAFLSGLPRSGGAADATIEIHAMADATYLRRGETCVRTADATTALSRLVLWCFYAAYGRDALLATIHAAAVGRGDGTIIMPGVSGAGKSTLTALLAAKGWRYGGDDIIALSREDADGAAAPRVLPFPSAVSVKDPSVELLAAHYPGLPELPKIPYDAKSARFQPVDPAGHLRAEDDRTPLAIVFPRYDAEAETTEVTALSTLEALTELTAVGIRTGERLEADALQILIDFFKRVPKYRLRYRSVQDAEAHLKRLS